MALFYQSLMFCNNSILVDGFMPSFSTCTQKALTPTTWFVCMGSLHDEHGHGFPSYPKMDAVYCCTIVLVDSKSEGYIGIQKIKK